VLNDAREAAEKILTDARAQASEIIGGTMIQLEKEKKTLAAMQKEVFGFKSRLLAMYKEHLTMINSMPDSGDDDEEEVGGAKEPAKSDAAAAVPADLPRFESGAEETEEPRDIGLPFETPVKKPGAKFNGPDIPGFGQNNFGQNK